MKTATLLVGLLFLGAGGWSPAAMIEAGDHPPCVAFATAEIRRALATLAPGPSNGLRRLRFQVDPSLVPQGYRLRWEDPTSLVVTGGDPVGAMYGGLDVAEAIRMETVAFLTNSEHKPFITQRGLKFNIPLDLRTPSYSDNSDAFQANIPEMWSLEFWIEFLDEMARHRFNVLSLWNLHPFPSLVKVPEYHEVALPDVLRGRRECFDEHFPHDGRNMFKPEFLKDAEVVKRMSIEEKIEFWRQVLQRAKDRGVAVYWFTWNAFLAGAEGKHGLLRASPDENMVRYFRASVRETVKTYPLLAGLGITAGEFMGEKLGGLTKEQWLWQTYGEGIREALKEQPGRQFRLIHRFHQSGLEDILHEWKDYPGPFDFSYKYAVAHMYASTTPRFIQPLLKVLPKDRRTWLTVRNDDIYSFRWGDPAFARAFVRAMPGPDLLAGFYMGPDGYCWGREAMDLEPESPRQLLLQKQWFSFMLWGRLSYDPALPDAHFERTLAGRFPEVPAAPLLAAWSAASRVFPEITRFHWGNIDLRWLPEACLSHPRHKGFYTVRHFVEGECMPGEANLNIREWREGVLRQTAPQGVTPPQVAGNLRQHAAEALRGVAHIRKLPSASSPAKELRLTLGDIESFAHLGRYYAAKIDAACALALYDATTRPEHQQQAIRHLYAALGHWKLYATNYARQYKQPLLYNRVGWVDIPQFTDKVAADVEIAKNWKTGSVPPPPPRRRSGSVFGE
jgi:hypothetical protein